VKSNRDVEELLRELYEDGPDRLPAEVEQAVLARLALAPQRLPQAPTAAHSRVAARSRMAAIAGWSLAAVALVVVVFLAVDLTATRLRPFASAQAGGPSAGSLPRIDLPAAPSDWPTFRSGRYGYSVRYPSAFTTLEVPGSFNPIGVAPVNAPGTDQLNEAGVAQVALAQLAISPSASLAGWRNQVRPKDSRCAGPESTASAVVDGAEALVEFGHCGGNYVQIAYVVRAGFGYEVYWTSPEGNEQQDLETFRELVGSVRFST
jgi:hypothetical protein